MNSGTQPSFAAIVEQHYRGLFQFALGLTGTEAEAGDLTQQTFSIWAKTGDQPRELNQVKPWLFTTLYREFLQSRHPPTRLSQADTDTVMATLQQVDELDRAPLALFYLEDLHYKDIAEILGVPVGTVQSRIARGKAQLANLLHAKESPRG